MGNCHPQPKRAAAEIAPHDDNVTAAAKLLTTARLYGPANSPLTAYLRSALIHKKLCPELVQSDAVAVEIGSDAVSGCKEAMLRFVEAKVPDPPFSAEVREISIERVAWLQHRAMRWHVERIVRWAEDLAARGGRKRAGDPALGTPTMEVRKFGQSYSQLLEMMLEHARMEETLVFPLLEAADRGICKEANKEHGRDLPIMNGIKEDIKSIGVMNPSNPSYQEALSNLSTRLKSLQKHCKQHFEEEEASLLPLIEALELSREQNHRLLDQCLHVMKATHSHLLNFFLEGLLPQEAMEYLDIVMRLRLDGRDQSISPVSSVWLA